MARAHLGDRFDIHTASVDLIFPHNENEIAQSRALTGKTQAEFWLHSELVLVGGKKMSYAEDTCVTLPELLAKGYSAREVRFLLLSHHYRQPVHLTDERLESARSTLRRIDACVSNLRRATTDSPCVDEIDSWIGQTKASFRQAMLEDLNTPAALAAVFRLIRQANYLMSEGRLCAKHATATLETLQDADRVLSVLLLDETAESVSPEVKELLRAREDARKQGDFAQADDIRGRIESLGYAVEDRPEGPVAKRRT
jgi:cysteinyl-tRNA synthetase